MHSKLLGAAALLLLAAAAGPAATAHDDLWHSSFGSSNRYPNPAYQVEGGVAGTYVGPAGWAVVPGNQFPGQSWSGELLCDLEVPGPGLPVPMDEHLVDGYLGVTPNNQAPDGVWDDGGLGGACHMIHYPFEPYNTPGCTDDGAAARDLASQGAVWIGAACDWETTINGTDSCGADGALDGINFGHGDTDTDGFTSGQQGGVRYPVASAEDREAFGPPDSDGDTCPQADAAMMVLVFVAVDVNFNTLVPATSGTIWQLD